MTDYSKLVAPRSVQTAPPAQRITFQRLTKTASLPERAHATDAGFDLVADEKMTIPAGAREMVGTGIAVALPANTVGMVCPRSGLAAKHGITVTNAPGIVDAGYRGEVKVILQNTGQQTFHVFPGDRIAQLVVVPLVAPLAVYVADSLEEADRGANGFGSTGA